MQAAFHTAIRAVQVERQQLTDIVGQARTRERQRWRVMKVGLACLAVGIGFSPALTYLLPASLGMRVASFIVGGQDRWESGALMMEAYNSESWRHVAWASRFVDANRDRIAACQKTDNETKVDQPCVLIIRPNGS